MEDGGVQWGEIERVSIYFGKILRSREFNIFFFGKFSTCNGFYFKVLDDSVILFEKYLPLRESRESLNGGKIVNHVPEIGENLTDFRFRKWELSMRGEGDSIAL